MNVSRVSIAVSWHAFWLGQVSVLPLSIFRVCIGLVLLKTAILALPIASVLYSDDGVLPRAAVYQLDTHLGHLSLLDALPSTWMVSAFFIVWAVVALGLVVGFQTRWLSIANFILILSVHTRNPYLVSGADDMLRLLSFWMLAVPLNRAYSVDAWLARRAGHPLAPTTLAFPVRLLQLQIVICYLAAGIFKLMGEEWRNGSALYEILQVQSLLSPFGQWLALHAPAVLLQGITYSVIGLELGFGVLVFAPIWQPRLRYVGIVAVALLHLGIALTMTTPLHDFVFVFWTSYLLFLVRPCPLAITRLSKQQRTACTAFALLMVCVVWQNIASFEITPLRLPGALSDGLRTVGLSQEWSLFAPEPMQYDVYIAVVGLFDDDSRYDLRSGNADTSAILPLPASLGEYRWGGFQLNVFSHRPDAVLDAWGRHYCRTLNTPNQPALRTIQIRAVYRMVHAAGQRVQPLQDDLLWLHACT